MSKLFYGVGYRELCGHVSHPRAYSVWQGMLKRCYDPKHVRYNAYGGAGVKVSKRWLCLDNFVRDMSSLEGWDQELFDLGKLQLDKDSKQRKAETKLYSRKTCVWLSKAKNNALQPSQMKRFRAISPDGTSYVRLNKAKFCRNKDLNVLAVSGCLNGRRGTHKGWKFEYI